MTTEQINVPAGYGRLFNKIAEQVLDLIEKGEFNPANIIDLTGGIEAAHNTLSFNAARCIVAAKAVEDLQ